MSRFGVHGKALRERREELGLSLAQVHEAIHVPIEHLRALESGDLRAIPAVTYAAGFLKSYCEHLGLHPEPILFAFRSSMDSRRKVSTLRQMNAPVEDVRPAWLTDVIAWGAVCGLIVLGWFAYAVVVRPFLEAPQDRVEAGTLEAAPQSFFDFEE